MKYKLMVLALLLSSCTLSFSNISTHGTASDVVDEDQAASPTISPDITLPLVPGV